MLGTGSESSREVIRGQVRSIPNPRILPTGDLVRRPHLPRLKSTYFTIRILGDKSENMSNLRINSRQSSSWKIQSSLQGPVAIFWDIENCAVPSDVRPEDVAGNISVGLGTHPTTNGSVTMFSAYGDFNAVSRRLTNGCHGAGVQLLYVLNDAVNNAILVDMFSFALDNRPPSSILLISGDVEFAPALHMLGRRGYTIILVIPSKVGVPSELSNAANFMWDWSSLARGQGFVPRAKTVIPQADVAWFPAGAPASSDQNESSQVPPDHLYFLRIQIVEVLKLSGGRLPLIRLPEAFYERYGMYLRVSGASELARILEKMDDLMTVQGEDEDRVVFLCNSNS